MQKTGNKISVKTKKDGPQSRPSFFYIFEKNPIMFKILAQFNKFLLPSFTKKRLDLAKATKWQKAVIAYRYYVTTRALEH